HMSGFGLQMLPAFWLGATLLVIPRFDPELVLHALARHRANVIFGLPVMYNALVQHSGIVGADLSSLELCMAGRDSGPTELQRQFRARFGVPIEELHGMTEVCPCFWNPSHHPAKIGSIGRPAAGIRARLLDDAGRDVPVGEVGEVLVRSEAVMVGYWD